MVVRRIHVSIFPNYITPTQNNKAQRHAAAPVLLPSAGELTVDLDLPLILLKRVRQDGKCRRPQTHENAEALCL